MICKQRLVPFDKYQSNPYTYTVFNLFIEADAFSFAKTISDIIEMPRDSEDTTIQPFSFMKARRGYFDMFFEKNTVVTGEKKQWVRDTYCDTFETYINNSFKYLNAHRKNKSMAKFLGTDTKETRNSIKKMFGENSAQVKKVDELSEYFEKWEKGYCQLEEQDLIKMGKEI